MIFRMIWIFMRRCKHDFIRWANGVLSRFGFCTPEVLTQLLCTYCMSFYGCALWNLSIRSIKALDVCINKVLRRIWSLPYNCHTDILHLVAGSDSIFNVCYNRFCKLLKLFRFSILDSVPQRQADTLKKVTQSYATQWSTL